VALGDRPIHVLAVVCPVAGERRQRVLDLIEQRAELGAVISLVARQLGGDDLAAAGVDAQVQLAPGAALPGAVLVDQPLAGAD
jgi:hypothetical protein